jgi:hypothetical protein
MSRHRLISVIIVLPDRGMSSTSRSFTGVRGWYSLGEGNIESQTGILYPELSFLLRYT